MRLSDKDILQIDATVTTGLLIFLTISFVGEAILEQIIFGQGIPGIPGFQSDDPESAEAIDIPIRLMLTMAMLAPFVISAVIVLANDLLTEYFERKGLNKIPISLRKAAMIFTALGFAMILATLIGILLFFIVLLDIFG